MNLADLKQLSYRIGKDFDLVQGAGGNTSFKHGEYIAIKASGKRLIESLEDDIFTVCMLSRCNDNLASLRDDIDMPWEIKELSMDGSLPSMEIYMHVLMPHKYVIHSHPLRVISSIVNTEFKIKDCLEKTFKSINFAVVPYRQPGLPLFKEIYKIITAMLCAPQILVLENHGIVVAADTAAECIALHSEVIESLSSPISRTGTYRASEALVDFVDQSQTRGFKLRLPSDDFIHSLAKDPVTRTLMKQGPLYPDHTVFCGPTQIVLDSISDLTDSIIASSQYNHIIIKDHGVIVLDNGDTVDTMLLAQAKVLQAVNPDIRLKTITASEVSQLLECKMEKHRVSISKAA